MMKRRNLILGIAALAFAIGLSFSAPQLFAQGGILQPNGSYTADEKAGAAPNAGALPGDATGLVAGQSLAVEQPAVVDPKAPVLDVDPSGVVRGPNLPLAVAADEPPSAEATGLIP